MVVGGDCGGVGEEGSDVGGGKGGGLIVLTDVTGGGISDLLQFKLFH